MSEADPQDRVPVRGLVRYPLLLHDGTEVRLFLPNPFTRADYERIVRYLQALAPEETP